MGSASYLSVRKTRHLPKIDTLSSRQGLHTKHTMSAATFDTLSAAHDLEAAGFEHRQAKAIHRGDERATTKSDLDNLETRINATLAGQSSKRGSLANVLVALQVFQQGFGRPPVAGGVPVAVVCPLRVAQLGALTADVVPLVDDGNAPLRGHFTHSGKGVVPEAAPSEWRQDDQRRAVALRAFLELVQRESREGEGLLVQRQALPLLKQRKEARDVFICEP